MLSLLLILVSLSLSLCSANSIYPDTICVTGDVQADYAQSRDPRPLMGTYTKIQNQMIDEDIADTSFPIYRHSYQRDNISLESSPVFIEYIIFKAKDINSWTISSNLPTVNIAPFINMTCFQDNLFDCKYYRWYWGYNKYEFSIPTFKVLGAPCNSNICIQNLQLQLKETPSNPPSSGDFSIPNGQYNRSYDSDTGRFQWINENDTSFRWYFRANSNTYNWVLSENTDTPLDRIACAPGYVDSPLFCTTFVYGELFNKQLSRNKIGSTDSDVDNIIFKMGPCDITPSPTLEPTIEPTIPNGIVTCNYNMQIRNVGDVVTELCEFGYYGDKNTGFCLSNGKVGNWEIGCYKISFSDEFFDFNNDQWTVYSAEGVSIDAALAIDGDDKVRFIPDNPAFVGIIRSKEKILWPLRVRGVVEKRTGECNLWSIGLGPYWQTGSPYSSRINWGCLGGNNHKQMSLYNATYTLYDSKCWNEDTDDSMDVVYTIRDNSTTYGSVVTTSAADCASIRQFNLDILTQNPWQNAYLWVGSYNGTELEDKYGNDYTNINKTVIGRFDNIAYTKFFTDFDGFMLNIWNVDNTSHNITRSGMVKYGQTITSNDTIYQFTIPFNIRLGIQKPDNNGVYAQFVSIGGTKYIDNVTDDIIQIVWDNDPKVRYAISSENIYETGLENADDCKWDATDAEINVLIEIDTEEIKVSDELCATALVAKHNLSSKQSVITLGFIDNDRSNHGSNDVTQFTYIEVYQLPSLYAGNVANHESVSDIMTDIASIYKTTESKDNTAIIVIAIICVCILLILLVCLVLIVYVRRKKKENNINKNKLEMEQVNNGNDNFDTAGALPQYNAQNPSAPIKQPGQDQDIAIHNIPSAPPNEYQYKDEDIEGINNEVVDGNTKGEIWGYQNHKPSEPQMTLQ